MKYKVASVVAFVLLVACGAWMWSTGSLLANGPVTIAVQVAAVLLMIWALLTFKLRSFHASADPTSGGIVTTGPYRFIRHPIYAAVFYFLFAGAAAHPGVQGLSAAVLAAVMLFIRMRSEEILLIQRYPEYGPYAARTSRILPRVF
jgi:protein-S-isoprenylcysteine O-methyltransferase Ste14